MSVGVWFPELTLTSRRYKAPRYPETAFQAQNGAVTFIQFGQQQVNAELDLVFRNIPDEDAVSILQHYESITENKWVKFSKDNGLQGMDQDLVSQLPKGNDTKKLRWRYAGSPEVTSEYPGISTVSCKFVAVFYGA